LYSPLCSTLFPYTTLFRSRSENHHLAVEGLALLDLSTGFAGGVENSSYRPSTAIGFRHTGGNANVLVSTLHEKRRRHPFAIFLRSEEHTSELQSRFDLVCR